MSNGVKSYTAAAILLCSSVGEKLKAKKPLCFLDLDHKPVFVQATDQLLASDRFREVIVLLHEYWIGRALDIVHFWKLDLVRHILPGVENNVETIRRGMTTLHKAYDVVAVHDGTFPVPDKNLISKVMDSASESGFTIPVRAYDKEASNVFQADIVDIKGESYSLLSPIGLRQSVLRDLMSNVTEDIISVADLVQNAINCGIEISLIEANEENPRIIVPEDWEQCMNFLHSIGKGRQKQ